MEIRRPAQTKISVCATCNGSGQIIGPKVVHLTTEDQTQWKKNERYMNQRLGMTFFACVITFTVGIILIAQAQGLIPEFAWFPKAASIIIGTALLLCSGLVYGFGADRLSKRFYKTKGNILLRYGVKKGEDYILADPKDSKKEL